MSQLTETPFNLAEQEMKQIAECKILQAMLGSKIAHTHSHETAGGR